MTKKKQSFKEKLSALYAKIFNAKLSRKAKWQLAGILILITAVIAFFIWNFKSQGFIYKLAMFLVDQEAVKEWIKSVGIWGPLAFICLQILQTVISPIPGNIVCFVGGLLFGWWGVLLSTIGSTIGYAIVLALVRKYGRSLVEKLISKELLDKFDYLSSEKGTLVFFLIFLIPVLPDDVIMCIAGLTKIPIKQLLFLAAVGRFPSTVVTNQLGNSIGNDKIGQAIFLTILSLIVVAFCLWKRETLMRIASTRKEILVARLVRFRDDIQKAFKRLFAKLPTPRKIAAKRAAKKAAKVAKKKSAQQGQSKSEKSQEK